LTSEGSPSGRFQRVLGSGNADLVAAAAAELPQLSLADALAVVLVFARSGSAEQFERGAVRWTARYLERVKPPPDTQEAHLILDAVSALAGPCAEAGIEVLHALSERRGLRDLLRVLDSWQPSE